MIWGSIGLMTALDLAVIAAGACIAVLINRKAKASALVRMTGGLRIIAAGLFLILAFIVADLFAMWVLPRFTGLPAAMSAMEALRLELSWYMIPVAMFAIALGIMRMCSAMEQTMMERAARDSEERYRLLIEASPDAMLVTLSDRRIAFANSAAVEQFGADSADRLIGLNMLDLVHPQDRDDVEARREQVLRGTRPAFAERRRLRLDGSEFYSESRGVPFTWYGDAAILIVIRDITDRKEAEEKLRQAQKMEAVGQLTAGVAHDFNNLLTVVLGNLELLLDGLGENRKLKELAARAIRGATRGAELTQRLLAFSRKQALVPETVEAGKVVANMTNLLRRTLGENIEIETVIDSGLWRCEADPGQLEQALLNLALNARDAMPNGGRLTVEAANARLDDDYAAAQVEVEPGQYVMLSVTDTGAGMAPAVREKAFEPFFTTKEVGRGTGLGLSMVYGFVKQSGGHVTVYSEVGEGTTVKIYLPRILAEDVPAPAPRAATDDLRSRGETILVVEDDADLRTLAVSLLHDSGYTVLEAGGGAAALQQLETARGVNLLLTDVVLPDGMSGRVLADEVQRRFPGIRVLYMSGYTENAIIHHGRLDPDIELLQKPFRKADLQRKVRLVLDAPASGD